VSGLGNGKTWSISSIRHVRKFQFTHTVFVYKLNVSLEPSSFILTVHSAYILLAVVCYTCLSSSSATMRVWRRAIWLGLGKPEPCPLAEVVGCCSRRRGWVTSVRRRAECALQNLRALHCTAQLQLSSPCRVVQRPASADRGSASQREQLRRRSGQAGACARGTGADENAGPTALRPTIDVQTGHPARTQPESVSVRYE
jgi:hypothetical protein